MAIIPALCLADEIFDQSRRISPGSSPIPAISSVPTFRSTSAARRGRPPESWVSWASTGSDRLAFDPESDRLFAPEGASLRIYDGQTGTELTPLAAPGSDLNGVCLAPPPVFVDGFETGDLSAWSGVVP